MGKVVDQVKLAVPSHSGPLWWEKIGKVANWAKLAIPSYSEPLQWEKIGKVANWLKLAILSHSEQLWWEKIGKVVDQVKLAVLSHYEPLLWEKIGKVANWAKLAVPSHSEPLQWEKIGKVVNQAKLAIPSHSDPLWWEKIWKIANWAELVKCTCWPQLFSIAFIFISILGGGTSARTIMSPWHDIQLYHSWGGGGTLEVTLTCFNFSMLGGVHQPEPKCHIDLRFQLFHSWRGVHLQVDRKSVRFTGSGWLSTAAMSGQLC